MFNSSELGNELQALKVDVSQLLNTAREGFIDTSKAAADALADQITTALNELNETLTDEESHLRDLISDRPVATLASAFALGAIVGFSLRRH
ncbi:MAG TPA: hypothetical protein VKR55_03370 [Bradyrhizobium sp.]|uniref:hypothetical protein n=1 Tax=Bradyrhizobium sp. TaxID=376 RepID=UPI002C4B701F|nr:hypothetical protein [Bradyrhizobium sp.]HLZ01173.1 hypothetical protein [Bradyrhizobium sp.]